YLPSGTVLISDINGGLFVVREGEQTLFGTSSFSVTPEEGAAMIQFEPAMNGGPITVERRFEGRGFEAAGTAAATGPYTFHDQGLAPGNYSYRLRRTGANGRTYTSIAMNAMIEGPPVYTVSAATANPFDGNTRLSLSVTETQPVHVTLTDEAGTELRVLHDGTVQSGRQLNVEVNGSSLAPGVYFVHFSGTEFEGTRKLVRSRG
ncbi:MAG TPA: T9SS type A sorting domain-containing protein, partial [Rhodothermales bacterium]|nr:T9SS type A sorting domain-containing protein [Rhodothermales bacterium]